MFAVDHVCEDGIRVGCIGRQNGVRKVRAVGATSTWLTPHRTAPSNASRFSARSFVRSLRPTQLWVICFLAKIITLDSAGLYSLCATCMYERAAG